MQESFSAPEPTEYAPFYATYVDQVRHENLAAILRQQTQVLRAACAGLSETDALRRYAPGKWSVKEVVGHIADTERVFAYRALRIGRGDATPLSRFDENAYVLSAHFDRLPLDLLVEDFEAVRRQTLSLLHTLSDEEAWVRSGTASGHSVSTRALIFIIAGHARHHMRILADRYGIPAAADSASA